MPNVLLTAFEPYGRWRENSSWLTLIELTKSLPEQPSVTSRLYPVNLAEMRKQLSDDLDGDFDYAVHLGQAPGSTRISLEAVGLNLVGPDPPSIEPRVPLVADGPVAYQTPLPLDQWATKLRQAGIPCGVSYHAGTYLCNATLYLSQYLADHRPSKTQPIFIHLPLELSQVVEDGKDAPALPRTTMAAAVRMLLDELAGDL